MINTNLRMDLFEALTVITPRKTRAWLVSVLSRAGNEGPRFFHNHGEGSYWGLLLVVSLLALSHLRHYAKQ